MALFVSSAELPSIRKLSKSWPDRAKALREAIAFESAIKARGYMLESIPSNADWKDYRESLEVVRMEGENPAFAIRVLPKQRVLEETDSETTVIYVRGNRRLKRPNRAIEILEAFNPWTLDTLPFTPERTDAKLVSKKVGKRKTHFIRKSRINDRKVWRAELRGAGVPLPVLRVPKIKLPKVVSDLAYEGYKLEFGVGIKPHPHWRPSIRKVATEDIKKIGRSGKVSRVFRDNAFTGWKKWNGIATPRQITTKDASKFVPFQRRIVGK